MSRGRHHQCKFHPPPTSPVPAPSGTYKVEVYNFNCRAGGCRKLPVPSWGEPWPPGTLNIVPPLQGRGPARCTPPPRGVDCSLNLNLPAGQSGGEQPPELRPERGGGGQCADPDSEPPQTWRVRVGSLHSGAKGTAKGQFDPVSAHNQLGTTPAAGGGVPVQAPQRTPRIVSHPGVGQIPDH